MFLNRILDIPERYLLKTMLLLLLLYILLWEFESIFIQYVCSLSVCTRDLNEYKYVTQTRSIQGGVLPFLVVDIVIV